MEQALHHCDIKPAIELATNLDFDANQAKATCLMEGTRCGSARFDTGKDGMESRFAGNFKQCRQDQSTDPPPGK